MCYTDKINELAGIVEGLPPVKNISSVDAKLMVDSHKAPTKGASSLLAQTADRLYKCRHKNGLAEKLCHIEGTNSQKSALREAIMAVLRKRTEAVLA